MKSIIKFSLISSCLIAIFVFVSSNYSFAQKTQQDVVYLKNGNIINGRIIEIKVNESITIINNCGDTYVLKSDDIERVEKTNITVKRERVKDTLSIPKSYRYSGFYSGIQLSLLKGTIDDTPLPNLSLLFTSGYQFKWGLNIGAGIGIDLMEDSYMPIILELKYVLKDSRVSPFFYINGGYAFALQNPDDEEPVYYYDLSPTISSFYPYYEKDITAHGGYIISPGVGFKINLTEKNGLLLNIGYRYMEVTQSYKDWNGQEIDRTLKYNRLVLGLTFQF